VLTNGLFLVRRDVREEMALADLVCPSLDTVNEATFRRLNRPAAGLGIGVRELLEGLAAFRALFRGEIWLEILFCRGINDTEEEVAGLAAAVRELRPDRVQLNTVVRPGALRLAQPVSRGWLESVAERFEPRAEVLAGAPRARARAPGDEALDERVLALVRRRPCTMEDIAGGLGVAQPAVRRSVQSLYARGLIEPDRFGAKVFYRRS
jgi:wyosine [tRNA(Phe)-imidazoG37] synthetase (radical SAM superfamily)